MSPLKGLLLLACLCVLTLPALLADLGTQGPQNWMEGISLLSSRETWRRQHQGEARAWLVPTVNGSPRLRKPPMLVWLNMVAWADLNPATAPPETLILRARLVAVALGLVLAGSMCWIGVSLQDWELGLFAAACAVAMLLFQTQARIAAYDIHVTAWAALASAAALWAIAPFHRQPVRGWRFISGAVGAGAALACAILSKGAIALPLAALPALIVMVLDRPNAVRSFAVLAIMLGVGAVLSGWWYWHVYSSHPKLLGVLEAEYVLQGRSRALLYYATIMWWLVLPWTAWFIAGLVHPFTATIRIERSRRLAPWLWFMAVLVTLCVPAAKEARYLAFALPAMAMVTAQVWRDHLALWRNGGDGRARRGLALTEVPHWVLMLTMASAIGSMLAGHSIWVRHNWLSRPLEAPLDTQQWIGVGAGLAVIAIIGWLAHRTRGPAIGMALTIVIVSVASWFYWKARAGTGDPIRAVEAAATHVRDIVQDAPLFYLRTPGQRVQHAEYEFLFYLDRLVPPLRDTALSGKASAAGEPSTYVMSSAVDHEMGIMRAAGFREVLRFSDATRDQPRILWQSAP